MKSNEFYTVLRRLRDKGFSVPSRLVEWNNIRLHKDNHIFCPITAVCYDITGKYYSPNNYDEANKHLKLHHEVAYAIVEGADAHGAPSVRKKIRGALGL